MTAEVWQHDLSHHNPKMGFELQLMFGQINGTHKYLALHVGLPGGFCFLDPRLVLSDIRKDESPH